MAISSIIIFAYIALQSIKKSPVDLNEAQIDQNHHTYRGAQAGREGEGLKTPQHKKLSFNRDYSK